ncbi:MAG: transposase [Deltaproteobacteria bacterium]|nr:transposase [Deltaproteobacteria bacterium]
MVDLPQRKRHHLPRECYQGNDAFFLTICSAGKEPVLTNPVVLDLLSSTLRGQTAERGGPVHAYVIMPDHVHILLSGVLDVIEWVRWFKAGVSLRVGKKGFHAPLWQKSFYDEGIRKPEKVQEVLRYMSENPVEAGLVEKPWDWAHKYGC